MIDVRERYPEKFYLQAWVTPIPDQWLKWFDDGSRSRGPVRSNYIPLF